MRYAENPPKKYEDIVNVDFYGEQRDTRTCGLRCATSSCSGLNEGVRIFRVDNPHTKPLPFWEWLIAEVRSRNPDVIFLSEAFTRPKMMYRLAKIGFSQSYTYFTWRNTKQEMTDYFVELTTAGGEGLFPPASFRQHAGHQSVFSADIGAARLSHSRRAGGDALRPVGDVFGVRALRGGGAAGPRGISEFGEIRDSRAFDYDAPGNIIPEITKLNRIRKSNPALQSISGLRFYPAHDDQMIFYGKPLPAGDDMILVAVSLDPFHVQEVNDRGAAVGMEAARQRRRRGHGLDAGVQVRPGTANCSAIRLDPAELPFAIWRIAPRPGG